MNKRTVEEEKAYVDGYNACYDRFAEVLMQRGNRISKGALRVDKAIHTLFEGIPHLMCAHPYGEYGRYITYYAEERLYLVFDLWYHGFFLVEADSPKDAINEVNCDRLAYLPEEDKE